MNVQRFKNMIGTLHEVRLSELLNVPLNTREEKGIDLRDPRMGVEVKSRLIKPESSDSRRKYIGWTLFDNELSWHKKYNMSLYCALGTYTLDNNVSRLWTKNPREWRPM